MRVRARVCQPHEYSLDHDLLVPTQQSKPTKRYVCAKANCQHSATFKPADQPRSKFNMVCVIHASKGMVCIKGPLCDHPDCIHEGVSTVPRRATFGFPGYRQRRCGKHKLEGMLYASESPGSAARPRSMFALSAGLTLCMGHVHRPLTHSGACQEAWSRGGHGA